MKAKYIIEGEWYETTMGVGMCIADATGRFPPAAKFNITSPLPRGMCFVTPRDVIRKLEQSELEALADPKEVR